MFKVNQLFDGVVEKTYEFNTFDEAYDFWYEKHQRTKMTYFIRFELDGQNNEF